MQVINLLIYIFLEIANLSS